MRTKAGAEIDFFVTRDAKPWMVVECKSGDTPPARNLVRFGETLGVAHRYQLVERADFDRVYPQSGVRVLGYERFLAGLV